MLNEQDYNLTVLRSGKEGIASVTRWVPIDNSDSKVYYVKSHPSDYESFIDRENDFLLRYDMIKELPTPKLYKKLQKKLITLHAGDTFCDLGKIGIKVDGISRTIPILCYTPLLLEIIKGTLQCLQAFHLKGIVHVDFKADNICANVFPLVSTIKKPGTDITIIPSDIKLIDFSYSILDKHPLDDVPPVDAKSGEASYLCPHFKEILNSKTTNESKIQRLESELDYGADLFGLGDWIETFLRINSCIESIKITAKKFGIKYSYFFDLMEELKTFTGENDYSNWQKAVKTQNPDLLPHGKWIEEIDTLLEKAQENGYVMNESYTFKFVQVLAQFKSSITPPKESKVTPPIAPEDKPAFLKKKKDSTVIYSDKKKLPKNTASKLSSKFVLYVLATAFVLILGYYLKDLMPNNVIDIVTDKIEPISQGQVKPKPQATTPQVKVDQAQIDNLLRLAQEDLNNIRLTHPPENNAFNKFSRILDLDKNNTQAKKGFIQIIAKYLNLVEERLNQNKLTQAQKYITKAKYIRQQYNQRGYDKNEFYGVTSDTSLSNIEKQEQKIADAIGQINNQQQLDREIRQLVKNIQQELKRLKYPKLLINGSQNKATINAIKAYQKAKGLSQNGYVSAALYAKLQAEKAWPEQKSTQQPIEQPLQQPLQQPEPIQTTTESPQCTNCPQMVNIPGLNIAMSTTEITYNHWQACINDGVCKYSPPDTENWGKGKRPVVYVNWDDAQQYIKWLSKKTGQKYRLPTEKEWQHAAKGGTNTNFSWGRNVGINKANCADCKSQWDNEKTAPVKSFAPNGYGLYDMSGNVWEWSSSCFSPDYLPECYIKGGAFDSTSEEIKPMFTNDGLEIRKNTRANNIGFRVVEIKKSN